MPDAGVQWPRLPTQPFPYKVDVLALPLAFYFSCANGSDPCLERRVLFIDATSEISTAESSKSDFMDVESRNLVIDHHYRRETQIQASSLKWQVAIIV